MTFRLLPGTNIYTFRIFSGFDTILETNVEAHCLDKS